MESETTTAHKMGYWDSIFAIIFLELYCYFWRITNNSNFGYGHQKGPNSITMAKWNSWIFEFIHQFVSLIRELKVLIQKSIMQNTGWFIGECNFWNGAAVIWYLNLIIVPKKSEGGQMELKQLKKKWNLFFWIFF